MKIQRNRIYLVHGTLGSGKTTFIKKLLKQNGFVNSYIIENEFANINIDKQVINHAHGVSEVFEVSGGCICCTSGEEFFEALNKIDEININDNPVIVETTGAASSVQLLKNLFLNDEFKEKFDIVANILVVDLFENSLDELETKAMDISLADLVILNKADLVKKEKINQYSDLIRLINNSAIITLSSKHDFDEETFNKVTKSNVFSTFIQNINNIINIEHLNDLSYEVLELNEQKSKDDFINKLQAIVTERDVVRAKGFFKVKNKQYHVEATKNNIEVESFLHEKMDNKLVLIGRNLKDIKI